MKHLTPLLLTLLVSCARFHGQQRDISTTTNPTSQEVTRREIVTDLSGSAWFSSKQDIARFSAVQTDKSQSFNGNGLAQRGNTNTVETINAATKLIEALGIKSAAGL